jgi:phage-related tail protein
MNRQQKKTEKFINAFCAGMDDELMRLVLRTAYLGEDESKFNEFVESNRKEYEEYSKHFELTDVAQTTISEEEQQAIISQHIIDTNAKSDSNSSSDKGHSDISSEHPVNNGISVER